MYILEFIREQYPIRDRILSRLSDPYEKVANDDSLPYDLIGPDDDGHLTKLVEIDDERTIAVVDLISYTREDVVQLNDEALLNVWDNYMCQIDLQDLNIADILESVRTRNAIKKKREEQLGVLSL